jgi:cutinase
VTIKARLSALIAVVFAGLAPVAGWVPPANAQPCPDVEVVFARGTGEPSGVGGIGQAFVDALRAQVGGRSFDVHAVDYPASADFSNSTDFALTVIEGIKNAGARVESTAANCPNTRIVLGGFSQGAAVAGFTTSAVVPPGVPVDAVPAPMQSEVAGHVAAVVLFGKPSANWLTSAGAPPIIIGPLYVPKTIDLCASGDTICDGTPVGPPSAAHGSYGFNGMVGQAADFAASKL